MPKGRKKKRDKSEELKDLRMRNYRQTPDLIIKTQQDAVDFINAMSICLLFPSDKIELPNLLQGVYGMPHPMINDAHWDKETMWTWDLKDKLPELGLVYYGKFIQEKGTFLSQDFVSYFYSVLNLSNKPNNFVSLYQTGEISSMAKNIAELILEKGVLSSDSLRTELNLTSRKGGIAFQQAITNLQSNLILTNFGTEEKEGKLPSTRYELVTRVFYDAVEKSQQISQMEARKMIISRYLSVTIMSNEKELSQLFKWNPKIVETVLKELKNKNEICELNINDEIYYYYFKYESKLAS